MPADLYERIGTSFGKLPTYQKKPILLADDSLWKACPFLKGVRVSGGGGGRDGLGRGSNARAVDDLVKKIIATGVVEEIIAGSGGETSEVIAGRPAGDWAETLYVVSLTYQGVSYWLRIRDQKEGWVILAAEKGVGQPTFWSSKRVVLFALLLLISAVGYYFEFGGALSPSNRESNGRDGGGGHSSNPTVFEAYGGGRGSDDGDIGQNAVGTIPSGQGEKAEGNMGQNGVGTLPSDQGEDAGMDVGQHPVGTIPSDQGEVSGMNADHADVSTIPSKQGGKAGSMTPPSTVGTLPSDQKGQTGVSKVQLGSPDQKGEYPKAAPTNTQQGSRQGAQPTVPAQSAKQPTQPGNPGSPLLPYQPKSTSPSDWTQEKVKLQKEIDRLMQENEQLRNSLKQLQKTP
ncbi:hypothetical protein [Ammoniphilus resinae]|uniref:Uncharacterized protein n=1 Tax=Ammoniphilus resinae TaxID=861532 RepID=A0ABS4GUP7_9BACL|nr:hypothetical protein [Ammoniphilus resinae]MBP1933993.1 hypothetical protein [Ammoniphilus resinae]